MISVSYPNIKRVLDALDEDARKVVNAFNGAIYLLACDLVSRAARRAPATTGFLRKTKYVTKPSQASVYALVVIEFGFYAPYAVFVNMNTRGVSFRTGEEHFMEKGIADGMSQARGFLERKTSSLMRARQGIDSIAPLQPTQPIVVGRAELDALALRRRGIYARTARRERRARATIRTANRWE